MTRYIPYRADLTEKARTLRKNPTPAENKLWFGLLSRKQLDGYKFVRQKPLDDYIVDFYCARLLLAIEVDGDSHATQGDYDRTRNIQLQALGVQVIRYSNHDVLKDFDAMAQDLRQHMEARHRLLSQD